MPDWHFDTKTAQHSANVKVDSYRDAYNWKIEVTLG